MDSGYTQRVIDALKMTQVPDQAQVDEGTRLLEKVLYKEGPFPAVLLTLAVNGDLPVPLRRSAIVMLKVEVEWKWFTLNPDEDTQKRFSYSQEVKQLVRDSYLQAMTLCTDKKSMKLLGEVLNQILMKGGIGEWPTLEESVYNGLKNVGDDKGKMFALLTAYKGICKSRKMLINKNREPIDKSAPLFMPLLIQILSNLVTEQNETNAVLISTILACQVKVTRFDLPPHAREIENDNNWMQGYTACLNFSEQGLRALKAAGTDAEDLIDSPFTSIINKCAKILRRYAYKYATKDAKDQKFTPYCEYWCTKQGPGFWVLLKKLVCEHKDIGLGSNTLKLIIKSLTYFMELPTIQSNKDEIYSMIENVMFPFLRFTEKDQETFDENPVEYIRQNEIDLVKFDLKKIVIGFFEGAMQFVKPENCMYEYMISILKKKIENDTFDVINYESLIFTAERMVPSMKLLSGSQAFDYFLGKLQPLLESEHAFARFRACKTISFMIYPDLKDEALLKMLSDNVVKQMKDDALPVRAAAAEAMSVLLTVPVLKNHFQPHLKDILLIFLKIVNEYETDNLLGAFQSIFMIYRNEIGPFVIDLLVSLKDLLFKLNGKENEYIDNQNVEGMMESGAATLSCLESISEILKSPISPEVIDQIFPHIEQIMLWGFKADNFENMIDVISIFSGYVRKFENGIPDKVLGYLPIACFFVLGIRERGSINTPNWYNENLKTMFIEMDTNGDVGSESFSAFMPLFRNFLTNAGDTIFSKVGFNNEVLIEQIIDTIKITIQRSLGSSFPNSIAHGMLLLGYLYTNVNIDTLKNYKVNKPIPSLDGSGNTPENVSMFEEILNMSFSVLKAQEIATFEFTTIHNVCLALQADSQSTLQYLEKNGLLEGFIKLWIKKHPKSATNRIRKASFLGFLSLFNLDSSVVGKLNLDFKVIVNYLVEDLAILVDDQVHILENDDIDNMDDDEIYDMMDFGFGVNPASLGLDGLDQGIDDTFGELDDLDNGDGERDEEVENEDARYVLREIDVAPNIKDKYDDVNAVLHFEAQLQSLSTSNPEVYAAIEAQLTDESKTAIQTQLKKLKDCIEKNTSK